MKKQIKWWMFWHPLSGFPGGMINAAIIMSVVLMGYPGVAIGLGVLALIVGAIIMHRS